MTNREFIVGLKDAEQEIDDVLLPLKGSIPSWLSGILVRNGPGKFTVGDRSLRHWFDGLAMLHRFSIQQQQVKYGCKFLRSEAYTRASSSGKICLGEFATNPDYSFWERLKFIFAPTLTDNANINITRINDQYLALTETPTATRFEPNSLRTLGRFQYQDSLTGQITTAHPHYDFSSRALFNILINLSLSSTYMVYRIEDGQSRRTRIASIPVKDPTYFHSFGITARYIILVEFPLVLSPVELLTSGKPYIENYHWKPGRGTRFLVIEKSSGKLVGTLESDACFGFHHINSYEEDHEIVVDMITYPDAAIIGALYLDKLRDASTNLPLPRPCRYRLNLPQRSVRCERLSELAMELPRINYARSNGTSYSHMYAPAASGPSGYLDQLVKVDLVKNENVTWKQAHCYPGEPVFVANPRAAEEDNGILLSVVLDAELGESFLLVLDAISMQELARASIPQVVPAGFHGQFIAM